MVCKTRRIVQVKSSGETAGGDDKFGGNLDNMHPDNSLIFVISDPVHDMIRSLWIIFL